VTVSNEIAPVRRSLVVDASPGRAFEVFTAGIDRWWPKAKSIGSAPLRESTIEPFVGGRWKCLCEDGSGYTVGHVRIWEPASRLVVTWEINGQWKSDPRPEATSEVEVRFIAEADGRTRVELEHRHFERMGPVDGGAMQMAVTNGWPGMLDLYAAVVAGK